MAAAVFGNTRSLLHTYTHVRMCTKFSSNVLVTLYELIDSLKLLTPATRVCPRCLPTRSSPGQKGFDGVYPVWLSSPVLWEMFVHSVALLRTSALVPVVHAVLTVRDITLFTPDAFSRFHRKVLEALLKPNAVPVTRQTVTVALRLVVEDRLIMAWTCAAIADPASSTARASTAFRTVLLQRILYLWPAVRRHPIQLYAVALRVVGEGKCSYRVLLSRSYVFHIEEQLDFGRRFRSAS